jgi:hypothetical protein
MNRVNRSALAVTAARILARISCDKLAFVLLSKVKASGVKIEGADLLRARIRLKQDRRAEAGEMLKEELRLFPENMEARMLYATELQDLPTPQVDEGVDEFADVLRAINPYTMLSKERLEALYKGAKDICESDLGGSFVECGVSAGGSSALLAWVVKKYSRQPRFVYCFDTFQGMPKPGIDDRHAGIPAQKTGWGHGTCAAPLESLMEAAGKVDAAELIRPIKGLFQHTLPLAKDEIGPIALLHLDGDWYDSTRAILENLYVQTQPGAYLQIDDYGYWDGCRKAVEEFEAELGERFDLEVIDATGVCFRKAQL